MFLSKLKMFVAVATTAAVVTTGAGVVAQQGASPGGHDENPAQGGLAAQGTVPGRPAPDGVQGMTPSAPAVGRAESAVRAFEEAWLNFQKGRTTIDVVYLWSRRLLEAQEADPNLVRGRIAALQRHSESMRDLERKERAALEVGRATTFELAAAEFYRREAELWLAEAKAGRPVPVPPAEPDRLPTPPPDRSDAELPKPESSGMDDVVTSSGSGLVPAAGIQSLPTGGVDPIGEGYGPSSLEHASRDPRNSQVVAALERPIPVQFPDPTPLDDVLKYIKAASMGPTDNGIAIYVDPIALAAHKKSIYSPVALDLEGLPLKTTMHLILRELGLVYVVRDGLLIVTSVDSDLIPGVSASLRAGAGSGPRISPPDGVASDASAPLDEAGSFGGMGADNTRPITLDDASGDRENADILIRLEMQVPMHFPDETPLEDVLQYIKKAAAGRRNAGPGMPIYVDPDGLQAAEKTMQSPVILDLEGIRLKTTLRLLLEQLELTYYVQDGVLIITQPDFLPQVEVRPDRSR